MKVVPTMVPCILMAALMGCAPVWKVNECNLRGKSNEINRSLSANEQTWVSNTFYQRKHAMPKVIDEWRLTECSVNFVLEENPKKEHRILGLRFRFLYTADNQHPIPVYQFINPVSLSFNEIAIGSYGYSHYHDPAEFAMKISGAYIFGDRNLPPISDLDATDRDYVAAKSTWITNGYFGADWHAEIGAPKTQVPNRCFFSLSFKPSKWRNTVYGEYWLVASNTKEIGDNFTLKLRERVFGKQL